MEDHVVSIANESIPAWTVSGNNNMRGTLPIFCLLLILAGSDGRPQVRTKSITVNPIITLYSKERVRRSPTIPLTILNLANLLGLSPFNPPLLPNINNSAVKATINVADIVGRDPSRGE